MESLVFTEMPSSFKHGFLQVNGNVEPTMDMPPMQMTFSHWSDYKGVKILFDFWEITSFASLVLSCLTLVSLSLLNCWIKRYIANLEHTKIEKLSAPFFQGYQVEGSHPEEGGRGPIVSQASSSSFPPLYTKSLANGRRSILNSRLEMTLLVSFNYTLSLLLMLVAMTYQPFLFGSLVIGKTDFQLL